MQSSMWKRMVVINPAEVGRKIVDWTLNPITRPRTVQELQDQLPGAIEIIDPVKTVKINFIDTPLDTILIRLPPAEIIRQARDKYKTPPAIVEDYQFPPYYHVDPERVKLAGITAEELFYSSVGDYTTTECE